VATFPPIGRIGLALTIKAKRSLWELSASLMIMIMILSFGGDERLIRRLSGQPDGAFHLSSTYKTGDKIS
jgi:hypothetical protein